MNENKKGSSIRVRTPFGSFELESTQMNDEDFLIYKPLFDQVKTAKEFFELKNEIFRKVGIESQTEKGHTNVFFDFLEELGLINNSEHRAEGFSIPTPNIFDFVFSNHELTVKDIDEHIELLNRMKEDVLKKEQEQKSFEEKQNLLISLEEYKSQYEYLKGELLNAIEDEEQMNTTRLKILSVKKDIEIITKILNEKFNM